MVRGLEALRTIRPYLYRALRAQGHGAIESLRCTYLLLVGAPSGVTRRDLGNAVRTALDKYYDEPNGH